MNIISRLFLLLSIITSCAPIMSIASEAVSNTDARQGIVSSGVSTGSQDSLSTLPRVFVKRIVLKGNTLFPEAEIIKLTTPYTGREVSFEELQTLRQELTLLYINKGAVTSGVVVPDQQVTDGVITLHAIEGSVKSIDIEGTKNFRPSYISDRLASASAPPPVNVYALQETLQLLQQDERIKKLNAELQPGITRGESILNVKVEENSPYVAALKVNNNQSPSIGEYRGEVSVAHLNLFGRGDTLEGILGITEGANDYGVSYSIPLTPQDTKFEVHYRKSAYTVIENIFKNLDIKSRSETYGLGVSRPFFRTKSGGLRLGVTFEVRKEEDFLLGEPYSFSEGTEGGKSKISVLRFSQEWLQRGQADVIALRSTFNAGIDAFGATINSAGIDGRFLTWIAQAQWIRLLTDDGMQLLCRGVMQLSKDRLLPLEKFSVGGMNSVRGYRENQLVRDNGLVASVELRIPVFSSEMGERAFSVAPFIDYGHSWNTAHETPDPQRIYSGGLGVLWDITRRINLQIYLGYALNQIDNSRNSFQDKGIHFQLTGRVF